MHLESTTHVHYLVLRIPLRGITVMSSFYESQTFAILRKLAVWISKKTGSSNIQNIFHSNCHHLIDRLTMFCQNHIQPALFKRPNMQCSSMFTKYPRISMHVFSKMYFFTANSFYKQTCEYISSFATWPIAEKIPQISPHVKLSTNLLFLSQ